MKLNNTFPVEHPVNKAQLTLYLLEIFSNASAAVPAFVSSTDVWVSLATAPWPAVKADSVTEYKNINVKA